ncbi:hypothetical protein BDV93DRAFT_606644 [Ceratobasidium sp. AG-I]|nr:hypothetical protein BDV93DRAFT_606644 [Ceratobasidium sp. AG-I]
MLNTAPALVFLPPSPSPTAYTTLPTPAPAPMSRGLQHGQDDTRHRQRQGRGRRSRPPPHWFTLGTLRTLKKRLAHPPPPAEEERYFMFLAPRYNIPLEDVVADKHLPPLSLQDFEDYLQHVEGTPENLQFHLWVRCYRRLYNKWVETVLPTANLPSSSHGAYRSRDLWERLRYCQDRELKEQFSFAKAQFFESDGSMRLNIDDDLRQSVLSISNLPPKESQELTDKLPSFPNQPEPSIFDAILREVDAALQAACERFVRLAFCNSGLWHSCLGNLVGSGLLAAGLTLWSLGVGKVGSRGFVGGSLPLMWLGLWLMLQSLTGHCIGIYFIGDARQLYPHEAVRPLPVDIKPPPVYSLAPPSDEVPPPYLGNRKASGAPTFLPPAILASSPVPPRRSYQPWSYLNVGRRKSEGMLRMFGRRESADDANTMEMGILSKTENTEEIELKLPPPRKTKDVTRQSFNIEAPSTGDESGAMAGLAPPPPALMAVRRGGVDMSTGWEEQLESRQFHLQFSQSDVPDRPGEFTEENDFGIVVSEAFEEDGPHQYSPVYPPTQSYPFPQPDEIPATPRSTVDPPLPQTSTCGALAPLTPLIQVPECAARWRRTMPDIFAPTPRQEEVGSADALKRPEISNPTLDWVTRESSNRRGSRPLDQEASGPTKMWPWPRKLLGPMTLVHSPLVKRAHWVVTVRCAGVAMAVTCGMALGLIR